MMFLVGNFIVRAHGRNFGGIVIFFMDSTNIYTFLPMPTGLVANIQLKTLRF